MRLTNGKTMKSKKLPVATDKQKVMAVTHAYLRQLRSLAQWLTPDSRPSPAFYKRAERELLARSWDDICETYVWSITFGFDETDYNSWQQENGFALTYVADTVMFRLLPMQTNPDGEQVPLLEWDGRLRSYFAGWLPAPKGW